MGWSQIQPVKHSFIARTITSYVVLAAVFVLLIFNGDRNVHNEVMRESKVRCESTQQNWRELNLLILSLLQYDVQAAKHKDVLLPVEEARLKLRLKAFKRFTGSIQIPVRC